MTSRIDSFTGAVSGFNEGDSLDLGDVLSGGQGADTFTFKTGETGSGNADTIVDYSHAEETRSIFRPCSMRISIPAAI